MLTNSILTSQEPCYSSYDPSNHSQASPKAKSEMCAFHVLPEFYGPKGTPLPEEASLRRTKTEECWLLYCHCPHRQILLSDLGVVPGPACTASCPAVYSCCGENTQDCLAHSCTRSHVTNNIARCWIFRMHSPCLVIPCVLANILHFPFPAPWP